MVAPGGSRPPLGPRAELQAHRFVKQIDGMSFLPDVADPRAMREGLPCPISHVRSPTGPVSGS